MEYNTYSKKFFPLMLVCFVLASLIIFYYSLALPFFSDDFLVIYRLSKGNFNAGSFFRPLGDASLYIDWLIAGNKPFWFHLINTVLHGVISFFVAILAIEVLVFLNFQVKNFRNTGLLVGFIFLIYPYHAEAVIWIVGRGVLLSALAGIISIILFCRFGKSNAGYGGALLFFFIALLGYETAIAIPLLIIILSYISKRSVKKALVSASGFLIIFFLFLILRVSALNGSHEEESYFRMNESIFKYGCNFLALFMRSIVPPSRDSNDFIISTIITGISCLTIGVLLFKKMKLVFIEATWLVLLFIITLFPAVTVGIDTHDYEGGRFLYFSSVFFAIMIIYLIEKLASSSFRAIVISILITGLFLFSLSEVKKSWKEAAGIVSNIVGAKERFSKTNFFINVPDSKNGAYIFRNGFVEAMRMNHLISDSQKIEIVSYKVAEKSDKGISADPNPWECSGHLIKNKSDGIERRLPFNNYTVFYFQNNKFHKLCSNQ
jgi:hypothetical protein